MAQKEIERATDEEFKARFLQGYMDLSGGAESDYWADDDLEEVEESTSPANAHKEVRRTEDTLTDDPAA